MVYVRKKADQKLLLEFIQENDAADIALQAVASALHYSDVYFCKILKQCFDQNFTSDIAEYRIKQAKRLLKDITVNVKEISEKVGYQDSNYFAKVFKRLEGKTPSEYRLEYLGRSEVID